MKKIYVLLFVLLVCFIHIQAQTSESSTENRGPGWFFTPEFSQMFLPDHVGNAVGVSLGTSLWKRRIKVGLMAYGRSGPINGHTYTVTTASDQLYKGQSEITLRSDHGAFGLMIAPTFHIKGFEIDVPIMVGTLGAGFYLTGEDRDTPDGRRVSAWENELMDGRDAGFGTMVEGGLRVMAPTGVKGIRFGAGIHYTATQGWETYVDPSGDMFNNKIRLSLLLHFSDR